MKRPRAFAAACVLAALFAGLYALQILSPLRLNTDAQRLLSMAVSAADGHGFLVDGKPDLYPKGYPILLVGMFRAGLGSALALNAMNILCVLAGCCVFHRLLACDAAIPPATRLLLAVLPLGSWVCIKHAPIPLSDNAYLLVSMTALLLLCRAWKARGWHAAAWLLLALTVSVAAFRVRTIGLSLLATTALVACAHPGTRSAVRRWLPESRFAKWALALALAAVVGLGATLFWQHKTAQALESGAPDYLEQQHGAAEGGLAGFLALTTRSHTQELGEIFLNLPETRFPPLAPVFLAAGIATLALLTVGLLPLARRFPPLAIYAVGYCGILFVWPFYDPRFWMPLLPLLALAGWLAVERWRTRAAVRWALAGYAGAFLALGLAALAHSSRLSLAGRNFPQHYGDGTSRDSYRVAFGLATRAETGPVNESLIRLLQRFEPLARETGNPR